MRVQRRNHPSGLVGGTVLLLAVSACWRQPETLRDREEPVAQPGSIVEAIVHSRRSPASWDIYLIEHGGASRRLTDDPALDYNAVFLTRRPLGGVQLGADRQC